MLSSIKGGGTCFNLISSISSIGRSRCSSQDEKCLGRRSAGSVVASGSVRFLGPEGETYGSWLAPSFSRILRLALFQQGLDKERVFGSV